MINYECQSTSLNFNCSFVLFNEVFFKQPQNKGYNLPEFLDGMENCRLQLSALPHRSAELSNIFSYMKYEYLVTPWSRVLLQKLTSSQQGIPYILWNQKFHHRIHKSPPPVPNLTQPDPVYNPTSHFLKTHLNIILPSMPGSPKWSPSLRFPHQNPVYTSPLPHMCYMPHPSQMQHHSQLSLYICFVLATQWHIFMKLFCVQSHTWKWSINSASSNYDTYIIAFIRLLPQIKMNLWKDMEDADAQGSCDVALDNYGNSSDIHFSFHLTNKQNHTKNTLN